MKCVCLNSNKKSNLFCVLFFGNFKHVRHVLKLTVLVYRQCLPYFLFFCHRYPKHPYISCIPLSSLKYFAEEISPVWTYILLRLVTQSRYHYLILHTLSKSGEYEYQTRVKGQCIFTYRICR